MSELTGPPVCAHLQAPVSVRGQLSGHEQFGGVSPSILLEMLVSLTQGHV